MYAKDKLARLSGVLWAACLMVACSGSAPTTPASESPSVPLEAPTALPPRSEVETAIMQAYDQTFKEKIFRPAYFACGNEKITTTTYFRTGSRSRLLTLYTSTDGRTVISSSSSTFMTPAGSFKALVAILRYPETFTDGALGAWEAAQRSISADYASYTDSKGHSGPFVTFEHTNVMMDPSQVPDPNSLTGVRSALAQQGQSVSGYDFLISLNLVPGKSEGGFSTPGSDPGFIYMGNFSSFKAPLTSANMTSIAGAIYYHEVSHHWGWPANHDWTTASCPISNPGYVNGLRGWIPAALFGWEDVDGDGVPEIIDSSPYGRSR